MRRPWQNKLTMYKVVLKCKDANAGVIATFILLSSRFTTLKGYVDSIEADEAIILGISKGQADKKNQHKTEMIDIVFPIGSTLHVIGKEKGNTEMAAFCDF